MARRRSGKRAGGAGATTNGAAVGHEAELYHAWRDDADVYEDVAGFCKSAPLDEVRRHGHVLTPGRYVGAEPQPDDGEPFEAKMGRLVADSRLIHLDEQPRGRRAARVTGN